MIKTIVPKISSSFCARSMFFLDIGRDYVRSYLCKSDKADLGIINKLYEDMAAEALKDVEAFEVSRDEMVFEKSVEIRYQGQLHVLEIRLPETEITAQDIEGMEKEFHKLHKELFTFSLSCVPMEMINLRLTAKIKSQKIPIKKIAAGKKDASKALLRKKNCYFDSRFIEAPVYDGLKLEAGSIIRGNAVIEEPTTTTVIPTDIICTVDAFGNYIITTEK